MRLTVEKDRESIRRYGHIKPARAWGGSVCSAKCPGTVRTCTLERRHRGPHVAHSMFGRVVAVWDKGAEARKPGENQRAAVGPRAPGEVWTGGLGEVLEVFRSRFVNLGSSVGEIAALILLLGFVVFAIEWFLLIFAS